MKKINEIKNFPVRYKPAVIWLTGLPGAGKSTIAEKLVEELRLSGAPVEHLDGDKIRNTLLTLGFTKQDRDAHVKRIGQIASDLEKKGFVVVASFVSPYRETRNFVRHLCHHFVEVHVSTPLKICESRDPKGMYLKARQGLIQNFTGVSGPYEAPLSPEFTLDTSRISLHESVEQLKKFILSSEEPSLRQQSHD